MSSAVVKHVRGLFRAVASPAPTLPQPDESESDDPIPIFVPYELLFDSCPPAVSSPQPQPSASPASATSFSSLSFSASGSGRSFNAQQQSAMRVAAEPANSTHSRFFVSPLSFTISGDVFSLWRDLYSIIVLLTQILFVP